MVALALALIIIRFINVPEHIQHAETRSRSEADGHRVGKCATTTSVADSACAAAWPEICRFSVPPGHRRGGEGRHALDCIVVQCRVFLTDSKRRLRGRRVRPRLRFVKGIKLNDYNAWGWRGAMYANRLSASCKKLSTRFLNRLCNNGSKVLGYAPWSLTTFSAMT